ncbi:hypothetical protein ANTQUA_LOCUS6926 [Anthophora quadrimaculata]
MVVARCASGTCLRMEALEYQDSITVAYSTWDYRRNASIQEFSVVLVIIIYMRLFYLSSTMVVARCASGTCFLQKCSRTRIPPPLLTQHGIIHEKPHHSANNENAFILPFQHDGCSEMCFRHELSIEASANQDSTTVAYPTWQSRRNASLQVFSLVIVLRIELRLFYLSRTVVVARCASNRFTRIEALDYQDSTTVAYPTW